MDRVFEGRGAGGLIETRKWSKGKMAVSHTVDPGSSPGLRGLFFSSGLSLTIADHQLVFGAAPAHSQTHWFHCL